MTNLLAGLMGSRWGIKWTLLSGLSLQLVGISVLYGWQDDWAQANNRWKAIVFVTCAQVRAPACASVAWRCLALLSQRSALRCCPAGSHPALARPRCSAALPRI